jgi:hypothetical protein
MNTVSVVVIVGLVVMVGLMGVACYAKGRADEQKRWLRMSRTPLAQRFLALAAEEIAAAQGLAVAELDDAGLLTELLATGNQITLAKLTAPDVGALERRAEQLRAQSYGVNHAAAA